MGDCTWYTVEFDRGGIGDEVLDKLTARLEFDRWNLKRARVGLDPQMLETTTVMLECEDKPVGQSEDVALALRAWLRKKGRVRPFVVREDPFCQWLGTMVTHDPEVLDGALHCVDCDADGRALVACVDVVAMVQSAGGSFEHLVCQLRTHFGPVAFDGRVTAAG